LASTRPSGAGTAAPASTRGVAETGVSTIVLAGVGALQGLLFLRAFGISARTDGFFAAYALYIVVGLLGQTLRTSAVPLLVGATSRMTVGDFAWAIAALCGVLGLVCYGLAAPLATVLAPGLDAAGRDVTESGLRLLAAAVALQLVAAGAATVLGIQGRLARPARSYSAGALVGLVGFVALIGPANEQALAWAAVIAGAVTVGLMAPALRGTRVGRPQVRLVPRHIAWLLVSSVLGLTLAGLYVPTLALVSGTGEGTVTILAYAYVLVGYLNGVTAGAVSMGTMIALAPVHADARALVDRSLRPAFRHAFLVAAPGLAVSAVVAPPVLHALLPGQVGPDDTATLQEFILLLGGWLIAALLAALTFPALYSAGLMLRVNVLLAPLVAVHIGAGLAARAAFGAEGVVAAMAFAPTLLVCLMLWMSHGRHALEVAAGLAADGALIGGVAAVGIGLPAVLAAALGGAAAQVVAALAGLCLYGAIVLRALPVEARAFVALLRRVPARS
jgi:peptidoglycan biosynthesis protein MviN/MurJ (putative lipid II flippase)